jgi:uncharacterized protein (TIRG00374 family)
MKNIRWKVILGLLISFGFLAYALSSVDYVEMMDAFSEANYIWTIPMMLSVIFAMMIRAARWKWLIKPIAKIPFRSLYASVMIGFMANNLLPARIGEVVRAVSLSHRHALSKSSVFGTVVAERVFDSIGILIVFFISLIAIDLPGELQKASVIVLFLTAGLLIFLYVLRIKTNMAIRIITGPIKIISESLAQKADTILGKFAEGLSILTSPIYLLIILLYSVFLWAFTGISGYLMFIAFGLYPPIWAAFIMLFVSVLAVSLPSSPGYIGTYHAACIVGFGLINKLGMFNGDVSNSVALSFSIVIWSCQFFPVTLIGLYYLRKEHLKFSDIGDEKIINSTTGQ